MLSHGSVSETDPNRQGSTSLVTEQVWVVSGTFGERFVNGGGFIPYPYPECVAQRLNILDSRFPEAQPWVRDVEMVRDLEIWRATEPIRHDCERTWPLLPDTPHTMEQANVRKAGDPSPLHFGELLQQHQDLSSIIHPPLGFNRWQT